MLVNLIRSVILYVLLILVIRLMGKRELGEMEPSEFVVALLIADLAAVPMQDLGIPLLTGVIPILTILGLELILSVLSYHSITFRKLLCGKPVIVMENGKILQESMRKNRLTPDELTELLRQKGIVDLTTVKYAILETNGQISALVDPKDQPPTASDLEVTVLPMELPISLISCGHLLRDNLKLSGRSEAWLMDVLAKENCTVSEVLLLTVEPGGKLYFTKKQERS